MKVRLIKDFSHESWLFQGTILNECILSDDYYIGIFESKLGRFIVNVPTNYCCVIEEDVVEN
jgi:hypothetical protein